MASALLHKALDKDALPYSRPATPGAHAPQIGFVGIGAMGYFMARNLATHGNPHPAGAPPVIIWNRTASKCEELLKEVGEGKVSIAQTAAEVAIKCDVIITNLANDTVVKNIYEEFARALHDTPATKTKIFVESSTIYPALAGELDALISAVPRCHLITSPVFGPPPAADKSQLIIVMSGDYRSKKEVAYLLVPAVGRKVIDLGGNIEKAPTFKLIGNSMILGALEILAESFTLAEKSGIGAPAIHELIKDILPAPPMIAYGEKMVNDQFDGSKGFAIDGGIKDASHIRRLTSEHNSPMPAIDVAHQHLLTARALHQSQRLAGGIGKDGKKTEVYETLDWSAIVAATRVAAGLDGFDSGKHTNVVQED